jgi:uncharacterized protein (TIGR02466 family)
MLQLPTLGPMPGSLGAKGELASKQLFNLFPIPMFTGMVPDITLCDRVEKVVRGLHKAGKGRSSPEGASLAYMTPDDIHTMPEMKELVDLVMREAGMALDVMAVKRDSHYITNMWGNISNPNERGHMHVHPNCLLSGLVYIKAPPNAGPTMFASPRRFSKNMEPGYTAKNDYNTDFIIMPSEKGRMLIWPSHVPHAQERGTADQREERIVVPFNVMVRGLVDLFTARITFA